MARPILVVFCVAALAALALHVPLAFADITVDPDGVGALDVMENATVSPTQITNPVTDDPYFATGDLAVGNTGEGALSITNGGEFINSNAYVGREAGSEGTVIVDGPNSVWTNEGTLNVGANEWAAANTGPAGTGTVIIRNGGTVNSNKSTTGFSASQLGETAGSIGSVTVDGAGSVWEDQHSRLDVGNDGTGILTIQNGGAVIANSAAVVVDPYNTDSKIVFDNGTLTAQAVFAAESSLEGTGTIAAKGWCFDSDVVVDDLSDLQYQLLLNSLPGQNITATIDLSSGEGRFGIGFDETVSMSIQNDMDIRSNRGYIGYRVGSVGTATVDGNGTTWVDNGDFLFVGFQGTGTLLVQNEAEVSTDGELHVGYYGTGALTISGGSTVSAGVSSAVDSLGSAGGVSTASGTIIVDGAGSTYNDNSDSFLLGWDGAGTITIQNDGDVSMKEVWIATNSTSTGAAIVDGTGSTWNINGFLLIGNFGDGSLTISDGGLVDVTGDTYMADEPGSKGTLTFGIGDNGPGLLNMTGNLSIDADATLLVTVDAATLPTVGQLYKVIEFDGVITGNSASFTNEPGPSLADGYLFDWTVQYNANDITLEVATSTLVGDFDEDGTVESGDLTAWQSGFGTTAAATHGQGDSDLDGDVDGADFLTWQSQYGMSSSGAAVSTQAVPEPGTIALSFALLLGAVGCRWVKRLV